MRELVFPASRLRPVLSEHRLQPKQRRRGKGDGNREPGRALTLLAAAGGRNVTVTRLHPPAKQKSEVNSEAEMFVRISLVCHFLSHTLFPPLQ